MSTDNPDLNLLWAAAEMRAALRELEEELENRADVDEDGDPNFEMRMLIRVQDALRMTETRR